MKLSQWLSYALILLLSGLVNSLVACAPPSPSLSGSQSVVQPVSNQVLSKTNVTMGSKLPFESFTPPQKIAVEGERRTLYVDPDTGTRLSLIKPTRPEQVKTDLLNQFQTQQTVLSPVIERLKSITRIRFNPDYCQVYVLEVETKKTFTPGDRCNHTRFKVNINGEQWAEFPLVAKQDAGAGSVEFIPNQRFIFAPCTEACEQPLQVEVFKAKSCNPYSKDFVSVDSIAKFEYDDCNNTFNNSLYFGSSVRNLLDSVEKRVEVMKRDVDLLMRDVETAYPNAPAFSVSSVKIPPEYYQPESDFQTQQFDEYDDIYDDYDEYDDYYDDYDEYGPDGYPKYEGFVCPSGNCVEPDGIRKDVADFQNNRIVQAVELLRAKVAWVRQTLDKEDGFKTKSLTVAFRDRESDLKNNFYNVDTTEGCYNYYDNEAEPRDPWVPPSGDNNGSPCENLPPSITLFSAIVDEDEYTVIRGRVNHAPALCGKPALDYTQLKADFFGAVNVNAPSTIETDSKGFFTLKTDVSATQAFLDRIVSEPRFPTMPVQVNLCQGGECLSSPKLNVRFREYNAELTIEDVEGGFSTHSVFENMCRRFAIINGPYAVQQPVNITLDFTFPGFEKPLELLNGIMDVGIAKLSGTLVFDDVLNFSSIVTNASAKILIKSKANLPIVQITKISKRFSPGKGYVKFNYLWSGQRKDKSYVNTGKYTFNKWARKPFLFSVVGKQPLRLAAPILTQHKAKEFTLFNFQEFSDLNDALRPKCQFKNNKDGQGKVSSVIRFVDEYGSPQSIDNNPINALSCSGYKTGEPTGSVPGTVRATNQNDLRFPETSLDSVTGNLRNINDAERKYMETFARHWSKGAQKGQSKYYYHDGSNYNAATTVEGGLYMFVSKPACSNCTKFLPEQFRKIFPQVDLFWVDNEGRCY